MRWATLAVLSLMLTISVQPASGAGPVIVEPGNAKSPDLVARGTKYAPSSGQPGRTIGKQVLSPSNRVRGERIPNCSELSGIVDACLDDVIMPREEPDDPDEPVKAELTRGRLLTAVRELTLPSLTINIQPGGETLINFDTIFYAQPQPFTRTITLLDYEIDIKATPSGYTWHHGDGTSRTTSTPGAAYPSKAVTYRYQKKAKDLRPSVDVTYTVTFRIDNGPWQDLGQTLTANGPTGTLDVLEATAVLTRY